MNKKLTERREEVRTYLEDYGPMHCSHIWKYLGIPRGSIYGVLRCDLFRQLEDSRWENAVSEPELDEKMISMTSGCNTDGKPFVHYHWGENKCQFSPEDARQHALHLIHCAEAAESDGAVFKFLIKKLEASVDSAAAMIAELRNFRAGVGNEE